MQSGFLDKYKVKEMYGAHDEPFLKKGQIGFKVATCRRHPILLRLSSLVPAHTAAVLIKVPIRFLPSPKCTWQCRQLFPERLILWKVPSFPSAL